MGIGLIIESICGLLYCAWMLGLGHTATALARAANHMEHKSPTSSLYSVFQILDSCCSLFVLQPSSWICEYVYGNVGGKTSKPKSRHCIVLVEIVKANSERITRERQRPASSTVRTSGTPSRGCRVGIPVWSSAIARCSGSGMRATQTKRR